MNKTFTPEQVAAIAGVTVPTVMQHIRRKSLKARRVRSYAIDGQAVKDFILKQETLGMAGRRKTVTE
jgi:hypothetical protein